MSVKKGNCDGLYVRICASACMLSCIKYAFVCVCMCLVIATAPGQNTRGNQWVEGAAH